MNITPTHTKEARDATELARKTMTLRAGPAGSNPRTPPMAAMGLTRFGRQFPYAAG